MAGISDVTFANLGSTPARVHRPSGKVWLNTSYVGKIPVWMWDFILAHEEGHHVLNTSCEFTADQYAFTKFINKYPDKANESIKALTEILPMRTLEQKERVKKHQQRIDNYNKANNYMQYEAFTNCGKYLIKSKQQACERANAMEAEQEKQKIDANRAAQTMAALMTLSQTQIQADVLLKPEMANIQAQSELTRIKLAMPGLTIDREKILPIAVGIAVVGILIALLLSSKN